MVARKFLGFDEAAAILGCELPIVRRLVREDKALEAVLFTDNGQQVADQIAPDDAVADDGRVYTRSPTMTFRSPAGYLRVPQDELDRYLKEHGARAKWPWGDHETELLTHLAAAAREWWSTYDPAQPKTAPTNNEVTAWLKARQLSDGSPISDRVAQVMAQMLRADGLPTGPRK